VKNEARYLRDWLVFHHLAGARAFFLYDDGSTDGTLEVLRGLDGINVTVIPWRMSAVLNKPNVAFSRQVLAYAHAIENFGGAFRWMSCIDIDEFIVPKRAATIPEALLPLEGFACVSLPWTMFGCNGYETPSDLPVPFAYTHRAEKRAGPLLNFKCLFDPAEVTRLSVHSVRTTSMGRKTANDIGHVADHRRRDDVRFLSDEVLQLNHYYTRSRSELAEKLAKGAVSDADLVSRNGKIMARAALIEESARHDGAAIAFLHRVGIQTPEVFRTIGIRRE